MGTIKRIKPSRTGKKVAFMARLSYVHLGKPWAGTEGNEPKYALCAIVPKDDTETIEAIRAAIDEAMKEGTAKCWKGKAQNPKASNFKYPLKDGDNDRGDDETYAGSYFLNASSKTQPTCLNRMKEPIDPEKIYSGCYGLVSVNFFPFATGSNGVGGGLNAVLFYADGEKLGGGGDNSRDFDGIEGLDEVDGLDDL